jgi:hypothetical protein
MADNGPDFTWDRVTSLRRPVCRIQSPIVSGLSAVKTTFDALRAAIGLVKDTKDLLPKNDTTAVITAALVTAESSSRVAEAEVAKALGYELCKCQFPPTPMLTIGNMTANQTPATAFGKPVFECPRCGYNNSAPFDFQRTVRRNENPPA